MSFLRWLGYSCAERSSAHRRCSGIRFAFEPKAVGELAHQRLGEEFSLLRSKYEYPSARPQFPANALQSPRFYAILISKGGGDMKKVTYIILSILANAALFSLGIECLLNLLSLSMAISLDSVVKYPRFIPFCIVLGIVALLGLIAMLILNIKASEKLGFTKTIWIFEYVFALVLSLPLMNLWEMLFDFFTKIRLSSNP